MKEEKWKIELPKGLDLHFLVWIWPVTLAIAVPFIALGAVLFVYVWIGNFLIHNIFGDNSPMN